MSELKNKKENPWIKGMWAIFGALGLAIILFFILFNFKPISASIKRFIEILRPFIIGGVIAYLVVPFCNWMENLIKKKNAKLEKLAQVVAVTSSTILVLLIIYLLIILFIPQVYTSIVGLYETLPALISNASEVVAKKLETNPTLLKYATGLYETVSSSMNDWVTEKVLPNLTSIIEGVGLGVVSALVVAKDFLVGLVVVVYTLADRKKLAIGARRILYSISGEKWGKIIDDEVAYIGKTFSGFLTGKLLDSAIIGVVCYIFCAITKMPSAFLVSVIIGVTNIIPFFGPFIGAIPTAILILIVDPVKCFWFVVFIIILQQIDGNILGPAILGDSTGISSFGILFSIILFGGLFGFVGMVIGVPLFAVIYDIIERLVKRSLNKKKIEEDFFKEKEASNIN